MDMMSMLIFFDTKNVFVIVLRCVQPVMSYHLHQFFRPNKTIQSARFTCTTYKQTNKRMQSFLTLVKLAPSFSINFSSKRRERIEKRRWTILRWRMVIARTLLDRWNCFEVAMFTFSFKLYLQIWTLFTLNSSSRFENATKINSDVNSVSMSYCHYKSKWIYIYFDFFNRTKCVLLLTHTHTNTNQNDKLSINYWVLYQISFVGSIST